MASSGAKIAVVGAIGLATMHEAGAVSSVKVLPPIPTSMEQLLAKSEAYNAKSLEASQNTMQLAQTRDEVKVMPQLHELRGTGIVLNQGRSHEQSSCKN